MSRRNGARWDGVQKCGGYNDTGNVHQIHTRFGDATLTYGKYEGHYQTMWYEGPLCAVFWIVGGRLNDTSTCYEHTFQVKKVEVIVKRPATPGFDNEHQHVKVTCQHTSYVGD